MTEGCISYYKGATTGSTSRVRRVVETFDMDKIDKILNPDRQYIMFLKPKPPSASAPPSPREGRNRAQFHV